MNPIKFRAKAEREYDERKQGEHEKAVRKYGAEAATLPSGNPEFDVMDFAINELVGLDRYGEMIAARSQECLDLMEELPRGTRAVLRDAAVLGADLRERGRHLAVELMEVRLALKACGLHLGLTEKAAL